MSSSKDPAVFPPQPDVQWKTGVRLLLLPVPDPRTGASGSQCGPGPYQQLHLAFQCESWVFFFNAAWTTTRWVSHHWPNSCYQLLCDWCNFLESIPWNLIAHLPNLHSCFYWHTNFLMRCQSAQLLQSTVKCRSCCYRGAKTTLNHEVQCRMSLLRQKMKVENRHHHCKPCFACKPET